MSDIKEMFPDAKMPTDRQRQQLCEMIHRAFLEIRILGWQGKAEQAADLADAFHNLPVFLYSEDFSLDFFRKFLAIYQQKYSTESRAYFDYLTVLDQITKDENQ